MSQQNRLNSLGCEKAGISSRGTKAGSAVGHREVVPTVVCCQTGRDPLSLWMAARRTMTPLPDPNVSGKIGWGSRYPRLQAELDVSRWVRSSSQNPERGMTPVSQFVVDW